MEWSKKIRVIADSQLLPLADKINKNEKDISILARPGLLLRDAPAFLNLNIEKVKDAETVIFLLGTCDIGYKINTTQYTQRHNPLSHKTSIHPAPNTDYIPHTIKAILEISRNHNLKTAFIGIPNRYQFKEDQQEWDKRTDNINHLIKTEAKHWGIGYIDSKGPIEKAIVKGTPEILKADGLHLNIENHTTRTIIASLMEESKKRAVTPLEERSPYPIEIFAGPGRGSSLSSQKRKMKKNTGIANGLEKNPFVAGISIFRSRLTFEFVTCMIPKHILFLYRIQPFFSTCKVWSNF